MAGHRSEIDGLSHHIPRQTPIYDQWWTIDKMHTRYIPCVASLSEISCGRREVSWLHRDAWSWWRLSCTELLAACCCCCCRHQCCLPHNNTTNRYFVLSAWILLQSWQGSTLNYFRPATLSGAESTAASSLSLLTGHGNQISWCLYMHRDVIHSSSIMLLLMLLLLLRLRIFDEDAEYTSATSNSLIISCGF